LLLVGDPAGELPQSMAGALVSATSSCVAIGTMSEADGATTVRILSEDEGNLPPYLVFEGEVEIPSKQLAVTSVLGDTYLERPIEASSVRIKIWVNDRAEPDEICIVVP